MLAAGIFGHQKRALDDVGNASPPRRPDLAPFET